MPRRLDNLVLDPRDKGRVLAVLDWELSTLGHPVADLAYSAMPYHLPGGSLAVQALPDQLSEGTSTPAWAGCLHATKDCAQSILCWRRF